ncbi:hypothetical protein EV697_10240 [Bisgaardia hudsonensis]|uniref:Lipoprotein n=1 Tax=Bisgaardia hudsonensis TaxID=109472 RepID=A0A4R2N0W3_9PAST|nr:hypothetical protein [Bisgaardia hudsonensis]QLB13249.1 hypothetical protein A6A11_06295 [Bisgaardia hudsonensis]TCP13169.1 hypothetical protein EV697_10240 [Bisgaardia hudsonensis]
MKKIMLAFTVLLTLGLTACSSNGSDDGSEEATYRYRGEVVFSSYTTDGLKLTIRKNDCDASQETSDVVILRSAYDSNIVVGACVQVSTSDEGTIVTNISRSKSRSSLSRTGEY